MKTLIIGLVFFLFSCNNGGKQQVVDQPELESQPLSVSTEQSAQNQPNNYTDYEQELLKHNFLDVESIERVMVSMPYCTNDNFTEEVLYDSLQHAFVRPLAYDKLVKAQQLLHQYNKNYSIIVYDALRPNAVQHKMWEIVAGTPKQKYVAEPSYGSIHNFGLAIDCSIYNRQTNKELDMGTPFDHLGYEAEYRYNAQLVKEGKITVQAKKNRELLRLIMEQAGFQPINSEWWHFNALDKTNTRAKYSMY